MAKRNNLLGVGGQRKKLSRADQHGAVQGGAVRGTADDRKQELLKKMRERTRGTEAAGTDPGAEADRSAASPDTTDATGTTDAAGTTGTGRE
ncbi:DUF6243 family protein [Streptomyces zaomyceticus]|uniref:DUF6243 family protein n=1 Tax=Streptomyces zaomyceticus TaxID=68286 RepID=UPI001675A413|nr:DUF6243 family protein [Streptomyces zaomyceticus]GHF94555.1 hypothetical protein GCM10018791_01600 [Streptomyces zaomyceticus]